MRKKLEQFRRKIREEEISCYKESIRCGLMETIAREGRTEELNRDFFSCLEAQDTEKLLQKLLAADLCALKALDPQALFAAYRLAAAGLQDDSSSQILRELVEIHSALLFSQQSLEATHAAVFQQAHGLANELMVRAEGRNSRLENYLAVLCCFYAPKYHRLLRRQVAERGEQLVLSYVLPWGAEAAGSVAYLRLLSNVLSNQNLAGIWSSHAIEQSLVLRVGGNLAGSDEKLVYWSLMALNDSLQHWESFSVDCLQQLIPRYLEVISLISRQVRGGKGCRGVEFKKQHLLESLISLEKMVQALWAMRYEKFGLGRLMLAHGTFGLFSLVNQIEHFPDRCILYGLLDYAICVALELERDDEAHWLIARELQETVMLGLANRFSNHITLNALHVIERLVRYQSGACSAAAVVAGFRRAGVQAILEYLQFNKVQEVAAISVSLLDREFGGEPEGPDSAP